LGLARLFGGGTLSCGIEQRFYLAALNSFLEKLCARPDEVLFSHPDSISKKPGETVGLRSLFQSSNPVLGFSSAHAVCDEGPSQPEPLLCSFQCVVEAAQFSESRDHKRAKLLFLGGADGV
jgi:hypothetical protein